MALKYRWSLAGSITCSLLVAIFWGANIGVVYPLIEVVFNGNSVGDWADERIATAENSASEADREIKRLRAELASANSAQVSKNNAEISRLSQLYEAEIAKADQTRYYAPFLKTWLPKTRFGTLVWLAAFMVIGTFVRCGGLMASMVLVARVGQRTVLDIQHVLFRKSLAMQKGDLDIEGTGDLINRIRGETSQIASAIVAIYGRSIREPLKMIACLACAAYVNWRLLIFSLLVCPLAIYLMLRIAKLTKAANKKAMEESARLLNRLFQSITYLPAVKAFAMEGHERSRFRETAKEVYRKHMRIATFTALARTNNEMVGVLIIGLTLLAGGYLVLNEQTHVFGIQLSATPMSNSEIMTFFAFLVGVSDPLRKMGNVFNEIQSGAVAAERTFPLYDHKAKIANPANPEKFPVAAPAIEFRNVNFAYDGATPVLQGLSFCLSAGSSLAIVGANGSGKSTAINLLPRFYDPDSGEVLLDGKPTTAYRLKELRRNIGYVTQLAMLFDDTIMDNIRYGSPKATDEQVFSAARQAHADTFIDEMELRFESKVGEHGGMLSGGQRQRLTLARAILKDAPILVLDEATSQIDPESERLIHNSLSSFIKGRTTIIITHRMSTLELVDKILVMDEGRAIDCGTHDELMARSETYRRIRSSEFSTAKTQEAA